MCYFDYYSKCYVNLVFHSKYRLFCVLDQSCTIKARNQKGNTDLRARLQDCSG